MAERHQQIRDLTSAAVLSPERELPVAGRPVVNVSFALNYLLGGLNLIGYRVVNIAIHVTAALLLFGIVRRTLEGMDLAYPKPAGDFSKIVVK